MWAGLVSSEGCEGESVLRVCPWLDSYLLPLSSCGPPSAHICVLIFPSDKDTSLIGLGPP